MISALTVSCARIMVANLSDKTKKYSTTVINNNFLIAAAINKNEWLHFEINEKTYNAENYFEFITNIFHLLSW